MAEDNGEESSRCQADGCSKVEATAEPSGCIHSHYVNAVVYIYEVSKVVVHLFLYSIRPHRGHALITNTQELVSMILPEWTSI